MNLDQIFSANWDNSNFNVLICFNLSIRNIIEYLAKTGWITYGTFAFYDRKDQPETDATCSIDYEIGITDTEILDLLKENDIDDSERVYSINVVTGCYMKRCFYISFGEADEDILNEAIRRQDFYLNGNLEQFIVKEPDMFGSVEDLKKSLKHFDQNRYNIVIHMDDDCVSPEEHASSIVLRNCSVNVSVDPENKGVAVSDCIGFDKLKNVINEPFTNFHIKPVLITRGYVQFINSKDLTDETSKFDEIMIHDYHKSVKTYHFNIDVFEQIPQTSVDPYIVIQYTDGRQEVWRLIKVTHETITLKHPSGTRHNFSCVEFLAGLNSTPIDHIGFKCDSAGMLIPLVDSIIPLQEFKPTIPTNHEK